MPQYRVIELERLPFVGTLRTVLLRFLTEATPRQPFRWIDFLLLSNALTNTNEWHPTVLHEMVEDVSLLFFRLETWATRLKLQHRDFLIIPL